MSEFVKRSGLAQPNDATWIAIFGSPQTNLFRPIENLVLPVHQQKTHHEFTKPIEPKQPKRRVFGELNPINPRGQAFNTNQQFLNQPIIDQNKLNNKRNFDGSIKYPFEEKENQLPSSFKAEQNENALPKPQPQVKLSI